MDELYELLIESFTSPALLEVRNTTKANTNAGARISYVQRSSHIAETRMNDSALHFCVKLLAFCSPFRTPF